jgi:MoaA/NifB/PqqE/SkfB family radical SAM enzyme
MCARFTESGALNPRLKQRHLPLARIQKLFSSELIPQLIYVYGCGVHGEPMLNPEVLAIYEYFRRHNRHLIIGGHTNGGVKDPSFWRELAGVASKINFSIDGLADTNHLYRQGVEWDQLMENVSAYIDAGGYAIWNFLVFKHNEHQVDDAKELARRLGFKKFIVKSTSRFINPEDLSMLEHWPAFNRRGELTHRLEPSRKIPNPSVETARTQLLSKAQVTLALEKSSICCRAQKDKSLYVDSLGYVFPCCFLGSETVKRPDEGDFFGWLTKNGWGLENFDSKERSLAEIIAQPIFQQTLPESWSETSFAAGKLQTCARYCGKDLEIFNSQFAPPVEFPAFSPT